MRITLKPLVRVLRAASIALVGLSLLPTAAQARDHDDDKYDRSHDSKHHKSDRADHDRTVYFSHPRSNFTLSFGTGYAGRGYYYGPPNASYYYERPEVRYYATREAAPREYYSQESNRRDAGDAAVQKALARRGYYHGSIDGELGPQSSRAIARYQDRNGLRVTGTVNSSLLRSLGLQ